jgi:small-conductance mechanosensitive channel
VTLRHARQRGSAFASAFAAHGLRPLFVLLPAVLGRLVQPLLDLEPRIAPGVRHAVTLVIVLAIGWELLALIAAFAQYVTATSLAAARDDRHARRVLSRVGVMARVLAIVVVTLTAAGVLVTFPEGRAMGASIFASAGIAGIVLGIAARPAVETLLAGVQVAFTEPFVIDDVVVVEGEWGRIEEITSTYVVVHIWDDRRLVLPLGYFLARPFQNWTRSGTALLAAITLELDYATPVEALRREAGAILAASPLWDRTSWSLQVTEAGERTMRVRVVASAADSSRAWDLRCELREKLIAFLQERHPEALPRLRAAVESPPAARAGIDPGAAKRDHAAGSR